MKKVHIIGAGASGLSLGNYLQQSGFQTEIYERHALPGGLCATWKRGDYTFDGAIHWIMGSNSNNPFYKLWSELIDVERIPFVYHQESISLEVIHHANRYGEKIFHLYTNIARLESYMLDLAPEDETSIRSLIHLLRTIQQYELPPMVDRCPEKNSLRKQLSMIFYLPLLPVFFKWIRVSNFSFAKRLKNPFLKEVFELLFDGEEQNLLILTMPLAYYDKHAAGYPLGGSLAFVRHLENAYLRTGGVVHYNTPVQEVLIEDHQAVGLLLENGRRTHSDLVVSCADWSFTVQELLRGKYLSKQMVKLLQGHLLQSFYSNMLVSFGVNRRFEAYPHMLKFSPDQPLLSPDGTEYDRITVHFYDYDTTFAPPGKTVVSVSLSTYKASYWIDLRRENRKNYLQQKKHFAQQLMKLLEEKLSPFITCIEEMDVATPATYHRYTNSLRGSTQGWMPGKNLLAPSPVKAVFPGLSNFYYASHWSIPGGGLPISVKSARNLALRICKKYQMRFRDKRQA